jgi:hypothetical protein
MPMVGSKKFPYTAKGKADAKAEAMMAGKPMKKKVAKKSAKKKMAKKTAKKAMPKRGMFGGM